LCQICQFRAAERQIGTVHTGAIPRIEAIR
jgi:hypothetical protein